MPNRFSFSLLALVAAAVCLAIAVLIATGLITSAHEDAWVAGGLLSFVLAHLP